MNKLSYLGLATFLGFAFTTGCVINSSDDDSTDDGNNASDTTSAEQTDTGTPPPATDSTTDDPPPATDSTTDVPTTSGVDSSSGDPADSSSGGSDSGGNQFGNCGWSAGDGFYACGGEGEDPAGKNPIACPEGLEAGAACGDVRGVGCCDANGANWYCTKDMTLFTESCE